MKIDVETNETIKSRHAPLAGVIGWPVFHSLSPRLHGHWLRRYGLEGQYVALPVAPENFAEVLKNLPRCGFVGVNVTVPHKETALQIADIVTDRAKAIGAANTLVFDGDKIIADNTDGYGFIENLRQNAQSFVPEGKVLSLLGAGGAARAVISSFLDAGIAEIRIANRTLTRAEALADEFGNKVAVYDWKNLARMLKGSSFVVNSTSMGMLGQPELAIPYDALTPEMLVTDLVYNPLQTRLLAEAAARGCEVVDGLGMLLHQAVPGFEAWFGYWPEVDEMLRAEVLGR